MLQHCAVQLPSNTDLIETIIMATQLILNVLDHRCASLIHEALCKAATHHWPTGSGQWPCSFSKRNPPLQHVLHLKWFILLIPSFLPSYSSFQMKGIARPSRPYIRRHEPSRRLVVGSTGYSREPPCRVDTSSITYNFANCLASQDLKVCAVPVFGARLQKKPLPDKDSLPNRKFLLFYACLPQ